MRSLLLIGALLLGSGPAAAAHPGARAGELFTFRFSIGSIESGRARMSIGRPVLKQGRRLVAVHCQAETSPWLALLARMQDDYRLVLDSSTLLPLEIASTERGMRERTVVSRIDSRSADVDLRTTKPVGGRSGKVHRLLPRPARDPLTALFALRAAQLDDGASFELDVLDGAVLWRARLSVRRELIRLATDPPGAAGRPSLRIDGETRRIDDRGRPTHPQRRNVSVWLSDDANHLLLRAEADTDLGRAQLELTSYEAALAPDRRERTPSLPGLTLLSR